ncbi:MAG: hypothetical protein IH977_15625 [Nitrospinae bacterium]|nr:hypothetical protein [Nitrospinota bacterium]
MSRDRSAGVYPMRARACRSLSLLKNRLLQVVRDGFEDARGVHLQGAGQNEEVPPGLVPKDAGNCLRKDLGERIDLEQVDMEQSVLLGNPFDGLDLVHRGFGWDAQRPRR